MDRVFGVILSLGVMYVLLLQEFVICAVILVNRLVRSMNVKPKYIRRSIINVHSNIN